MGLIPAAEKGGLKLYHGSVGRMLQNKKYLGDDYYPAIIDKETFDKAEEIRMDRAMALGRVRELKEKNIPVFFEKENINTMDSKGEVLLTIMASLAQQVSQSLRQNIKLDLQYRFQNGEVRVNHSRFLGYTKDEEGNLIIEPSEAEVVKRIYREYLEGISLIQTGRGLEADDILTGAGKAKWRPETLKKILQNEKYIGDALLQKTYTVVFLNKKRVQNKGIVPQYYIENSHEPIIPRNLYMQDNPAVDPIAEPTGKRGVIAANMPYPVLYTARSVGRFTGGSHGITGESTPPCGGVVPAWSMDQLPVTHRPFRSRICRLQWYIRKRIITVLRMRLTGCGN